MVVHKFHPILHVLIFVHPQKWRVNMEGGSTATIEYIDIPVLHLALLFIDFIHSSYSSPTSSS